MNLNTLQCKGAKARRRKESGAGFRIGSVLGFQHQVQIFVPPGTKICMIARLADLEIGDRAACLSPCAFAPLRLCVHPEVPR
jgi:hypothetical protein